MQRNVIGKSRKTFHTLDLLRGIAALTVACGHFGYAFGSIAKGAYLAVDFFFVMSGFVIAYAYGEKLQSGLSTPKFFVLRYFRLYPLYILGTLASVFLILISNLNKHSPISQELILNIVFAILFLPALQVVPLQSNFIYPFNPPAWSLFFELVINLVYGILSRFLGNRMLIGILIFGAILLFHASCKWNSLNVGFDQRSWTAGFERVIYSFFAGVAIFRIWAAGFFPRLRIPFWLSVLILLAIFAANPPQFRGVFDFLTVIFLFPLLVLASTQDPPEKYKPIAAWLGLLSYPIYAIHNTLVLVVHKIVEVKFPQGGPVLVFFWMAFMGILLFAAYYIERYFDGPIRKWLASKINRKRSA